MKIITLTGNQFEDFAKKHKYRSYFQTLSYAKLMKTDGYDYHLLGFLNNSNELIGASMILFKKIFFNYKIAYAPYGFLIDYTNSDIIEEITEKLKILLYKQKFLFLKINPRIECSKRDKDGNIISYNPEINDIMEILQKNDYIHNGFNNYFEDMKPRWNAVLKLTASNEKLYKDLDKQIRNKINKAKNCGVELKNDDDVDT
ncbi:MAG: peptidoglycan bridge formation glycyltransferase FemA/FemB family protein, partial [Bacilli bacterium]|nr:peptidoglycan bridge formation glycyltransferase FemA/FemB family protein [Bacilli bacterium]